MLLTRLNVNESVKFRKKSRLEIVTVTKVYTKILIETEKVSLIKRKKFFIRTHCQVCQCEVSMFPPADAAFLMCQDTEKIYSWMDSKRIHFQYLYGDKPFICLTSLCLAERQGIF